MGTNYSFNDFKDLNNLRIFENLNIKWEIYPNFKDGSIPKSFSGDYILNSDKPKLGKDHDPIKSQILPHVHNPYPLLKFSSIPQDQEFAIPSHRILGISISNDQVYIQFMPHGNHPIEGLPISDPCAWGVAYISGKHTTITQLHTFLNKLLITTSNISHPRCEYCQALQGIEQLALDLSENNFTEEAMVCNDCISVCESYILKIENSWQIYQKNKEFANPKDLKKWADAGFTLSEGQNNENLEIFFKIHQTVAMIFIDDINEKSSVISTYIKEISSFVDNYPNNELIEYKEKLIQLYNKNKEKFSQESEIQEDNIDLDEDMLVDEAIAKLEESKQCKANQDYQRAIDLIYEAADPLVEAGVWGEKDIKLAQKEVSIIREIMAGKKPVSSPINPSSMEKETVIQAPNDKTIEDKPPQKKIQDKPKPNGISIPKINLSPLKIPKLEGKSQNGDKKKNKLDFTIPDDIPIDDDAQAFADALQFEPSESDINDFDKNYAVQKNLPKPSLKFDLPDDIPIDEDAQALADSLQFEPDDNDIKPFIKPKITKKDMNLDFVADSIKNEAKKADSSDDNEAKPRKLAFESPKDIPIDEDAQALGDALNFEPQHEDITATEEKPLKPSLNEIKIDPISVHPLENVVKNQPIDAKVLQEKEEEEKEDSKSIEPEDNSLFSILKTKAPKRKKKLEKAINVFEEHIKSDLFFGTARETPSTEAEENKTKENSQKIFGLFVKESEEQPPTQKHKHKEKISQKTSKKKEEIASKKQKLARVTERRKALQKARSKRVEICPMCGKIAENCSCGYMK